MSVHRRAPGGHRIGRAAGRPGGRRHRAAAARLGRRRRATAASSPTPTTSAAARPPFASPTAGPRPGGSPASTGTATSRSSRSTRPARRRSHGRRAAVDVGAAVFGAAATPSGAPAGDRRLRVRRGARIPWPGRPADRRRVEHTAPLASRFVRRGGRRRGGPVHRPQHEPRRRGLLSGAAGRRHAPGARRCARPRRANPAGPGWASRSRPARSRIRLRQSVGLPERDGLLVRGVEDDSLAAKAGILEGDLIVEVAGKAVSEADALVERSRAASCRSRSGSSAAPRSARSSVGGGDAPGRGVGPMVAERAGARARRPRPARTRRRRRTPSSSTPTRARSARSRSG